jgi:two-component system cell cycle response regulator
VRLLLAEDRPGCSPTVAPSPGPRPNRKTGSSSFTPGPTPRSLERAPFPGLSRLLSYAVENHRLRAQIDDLLLNDPLTGLWSRLGFLTLAEQQARLAARTKDPFLLLFADVKEWPALVRTAGREAGDRALCRVSAIFRKAFRQSDILARLNDHHFAVALPETSDAGAEVLLTRLEKAVKIQTSGPASPCRLSLQLQVEVFAPGMTTSIEELMARADTALRLAQTLADSCGNSPAHPHR